MPFAATHILSAIIIADVLRDHFFRDKNKFPLHYVFLAGIAGILPDIDVVFYWFSSALFGTPMEEIHRVYTHSAVFPFIFLIAAFVLYKSDLDARVGRVMRWSGIFSMLALGYSLHLLLDMTLMGSIAVFFPFSAWKAGLNIIPADTRFGASLMEGMDAILLIAWLFHEEMKHKISDYI